MPPRPLRSLVRRGASLLAGVALLVAPVRPALACAMPEAVRAAVAAGADAIDAGTTHAHGHTADAGLDTDGRAPSPAPSGHEGCPDLAACAVVALGETAEQDTPGGAITGPVSRTVAGRPESPTPAVEPPPPRA